MLEMEHVVCVVLAVLTIGQTLAAVAPAGPCKSQVTSIPVDLAKLASQGRWKTLYGTDSEFVRMLDHATVVITTDDNKTFTSTATHVSKDNKLRISKSYTQTYNDGIINETDKDDQGNVHKFLVYTLAKSEEEQAYLFYRCSHDGNLNVDTRYIVIPESRTISDEKINQLLSVDQSYNFSGNLYKLPNEHI